MAKIRTAIPGDIAAEVLFAHHHTCCVCNEPGKAVQIHHIDENPTNHAPDNLAVLCFDDHERTQLRGGFGRKLLAAEVVRYRSDWLRRVTERRGKADTLAIAQMSVAAAEPQHFDDEHREMSDVALRAYIGSLPHVRRAAYMAAQPMWDSGLTSEMTQGAYDVADVFEQICRRLIWAYPANHFGAQSTRQFLGDFVASRFNWHRQRFTFNTPGPEGTMWGTVIAGAVMDDLASMIAELVEGIRATRCDDIAEDWLEQWNRASIFDETDPANPPSIKGSSETT